MAKYSTHKANKVSAIGRLVARMVSPAPQLFIYKALTAWAIPKLRGVQVGKRSTDMIVLPSEFYDMNTWDLAGSQSARAAIGEAESTSGLNLLRSRP